MFGFGLFQGEAFCGLYLKARKEFRAGFLIKNQMNTPLTFSHLLARISLTYFREWEKNNRNDIGRKWPLLQAQSV